MKNLNFLSRRNRKPGLTLLIGLLSLLWPTVHAQSVVASQPNPQTLSTQISNRIKFHGQAPDNQTNYRADPIDLCPNIVDGGTGNIQSQAYQFEFESNCLGNNVSTTCRYRPNFIWTVKYFTESGSYYEERWQDKTQGDFSKVRLYMYDRIPYVPNFRFNPTCQQATAAGGNPNLSPWVNAGCTTPPNNTAQPNELIVRVQLECTGYSCGTFEGDDSDVLQIRYFRRRPGPISVANAPTLLCRNVSYTLSTSAVFDATFYTWSAGSGATITSNGTTATLSLANVPVSATSVNVNVVAQNAGGSCGVYASAARSITLPIEQGPAQPQNMSLSNGRCPTTGSNTKTVSVTSGPTGTVYYWTVSGAGSAFMGQSVGTAFQTTSPYAALTTPQAGTVTISVKAKTNDCGGFGPTLTQSFQIGNIALVPPTGLTKIAGYCSDAYWCFDHVNQLVIDNPQPGLIYHMSISDVVPAETNPDPFYHTKVIQSPDGSPEADIYLGGDQVRSFRLNVITENPCPAPGTSSFDFRYYTYNIVPVNGDSQRTSGPTSGQPSEPEKPGKPKKSAHGPSLYPNPTAGTVLISSQAGVRYEWAKILDIQGRIISEQHVESASGVTSLDLKKLPAGVYQVQLFDGRQLKTERLVKE